MENKLTHINDQGNAIMVDVSNKVETERFAIAKGEVVMKMKTLEAVRKGELKKGDVLSVAKVAGIMAAKRTSELIPLCHPIPIFDVQIMLSLDESIPGVVITSIVKSNSKTGVEMEALTAVAVAALTVYDMAKAIEKTMQIQNIRLVRKYGGTSGDFINE